MADENIIRDFTTEQLAYLYDLVIDDVDGSTQAESRLSGTDLSRYEEIIGTYYSTDEYQENCSSWTVQDHLIEINNNSAQNLVSIWEQVGEIDSRYRSLFSSLKSCMIQYWMAVDEIAAMIDVNNIKAGRGLGLNDTDALRNSIQGITSSFDKTFQQYTDACVKKALDTMNITNPDERQQILDFTKNNKYSPQQAVALVLAAKTELDKQQLMNLVNGKYGEIAKVDPYSLSPEMLQAIGDYSNLLAINDNWDEITKFTNGFGSAEYDGTGMFDDTAKKYSQEYFAIFSANLSEQYKILGYTSGEGIANIEWVQNEDGSYTKVYSFNEPKDLNEKIFNNSQKLLSLSSLWDFALIQSIEGQEFLDSEYRKNEQLRAALNGGVYFSPKYVGFSIGDLSYDGTNGLSFKVKYQDCGNASVFGGAPSPHYQEYTPSNPLINLNIYMSTAEKGMINANKTLQEITRQLEKASDKLLSSTISAGINFAASFVPGGSMGYAAALTLVNVINDAISNGKDPAKTIKEYLGISKGMESGSLKDNFTHAGAFAGAISSILSAYSNYDKLTKDQQKSLDDFYSMWFGVGGKATGYQAGESYSAPLGLSNMISPEKVYAMKKWNAEGISALLPYTNAGNISAEKLFSLDPTQNSAIYNYLLNKNINPALLDSPDKILSYLKNLKDHEKILWFGENPKVTMPDGTIVDIPLEDPNSSLATINKEDILKFNSTCDLIQDALGDSVNMNSEDFSIVNALDGLAGIVNNRKS